MPKQGDCKKSVHSLVGCVPSFVKIHDIRFASGGRRRKGNGEGRFGGDREEGAGKVAEELGAA